MNNGKNTKSGFAYGFNLGEGVTRAVISGVTYTIINMFPFGGLVYLVLYHPLRAPIFVLGKLGGALGGGLGAGAGFVIDLTIHAVYDYCFKDKLEARIGEKLAVEDFEDISPPQIISENKILFFSEKKPQPSIDEAIDEIWKECVPRTNLPAAKIS